MDFSPSNPGHWGIVIPEDPLTGAFGRLWAGDEVMDITYSLPGQTVRHPVERGVGGPTDVVLRDPPTLTCTIRCMSVYQGPHPRLDFFGPTRAGQMATEFEALAERGEPVAVLVRGLPLLSKRLIGNVTMTAPSDAEVIEIQCEFTRMDDVTLEAVAVQQDADLIALGSQIVSGGTL